MTPEDVMELLASVRRHEGFSATPTPDSHGTVVIGWGRNLNTDPLSHEEADYLLVKGITQRRATLSMQWPAFLTCDGPRQRVLVEMAYQLGVDGLMLFKKMLHAIALQDYETAAQEVLASQLARQTPTRAKDYADLLRTT